MPLTHRYPKALSSLPSEGALACLCGALGGARWISMGLEGCSRYQPGCLPAAAHLVNALEAASGVSVSREKRRSSILYLYSTVSFKLNASCLTRPVRLPNEQTRGQSTNSACSSDVRQAFILIDNALTPLSTHTPACPGTAAPHPIRGTVPVQYRLLKTKSFVFDTAGTLPQQANERSAN